MAFTSKFLHHFCLGLAQDVPVDGLALWSVACCVTALPAAVFPLADAALAVGSFLCHAGGLLSVFFNHQHYSRGSGNVHPYVSNWAEKNRTGFWWIYTCRWAGKFLRAYSLFSGAVFEHRMILVFHLLSHLSSTSIKD